jgi:hypothetical protein
MIERFSENPKDKTSPINWEGSIAPLMSFLYLLDRFGFINRANKGDFQSHNTSRKENKEKEDELLGGKEVLPKRTGRPGKTI